jgi:DNA-binding response OmpR family regulator
METKTILAIDDSVSNLDIIVEFLDGFDVIALTNANKAFEVLNKKDVDLIILDIVMPDMNGFDICERLKKDPLTSDIPIIFITSKSDEQSIERAFEVGGVDYVTKPFRKKELLSRINSHLSFSKEHHLLQNLLEKQKEILHQQSKLAIMGEMIDSVAHQWIQPVSAIKMNTHMLKHYYENDALDDAKLDVFQNKIYKQVDHIIQTLNEFRSFLRPSHNIKNNNLLHMINSTLLLIEDELQQNSIKVEIEIDADIRIKCNDNEFKHVLINIINNSKDAFKENKIENKIINISAVDDKEKSALKICDNAGGIDDKVIKNIFEANVTTKKSGTGIGLYMSAQILKKIDANIEVFNFLDGSCFMIEIYKSLHK